MRNRIVDNSETPKSEDSSFLDLVNLINFDNFISLNATLCLSSTLEGLRIPICPLEYKIDSYISSQFRRGYYFDQGSIRLVVNELRKNDKMEFVDLGANIGSYTVAVARLLGRHVVAVEATPDTVTHLATAVQLNNVTDRVKIAHNAIGNTHNIVEFARYPGRAALNHVVKDYSKGRICSPEKCIRIRCIMLDDLIPLVTSDSVVIKADIEESEPNVFRNESAGRFFSKFKVPMIMMEFEEYLRTPTRRNFTAEWLDGFFYSRSYVPYSAHNSQKLGRDFKQWPHLIYWMKEA